MLHISAASIEKKHLRAAQSAPIGQLTGRNGELQVSCSFFYSLMQNKIHSISFYSVFSRFPDEFVLGLACPSGFVRSDCHISFKKRSEWPFNVLILHISAASIVKKHSPSSPVCSDWSADRAKLRTASQLLIFCLNCVTQAIPRVDL